MTGKTMLILPDSHSKPTVPNERYSWLARLIVERKPDIIVDLGDFADMESLSSYNAGKLSGQNRHLINDLEAAKDARKRLTQPIRERQAQLVSNKKKHWNPELYAVGGNHEFRVNRFVDNNPELAGMFTQDVSEAAKLGWHWTDYQGRLQVEGINIRHNMQQGGRPVGGKYAAAALLDKGYESAIVGDSHKWDIATRTTWSGKKILGLVAGCYFGHEEAYAGTSNGDWDRFITILYDVKDGGYSGSHDKISYDEIRHDYGGVV